MPAYLRSYPTVHTLFALESLIGIRISILLFNRMISLRYFRKEWNRVNLSILNEFYEHSLLQIMTPITA